MKENNSNNINNLYFINKTSTSTPHHYPSIMSTWYD